MKFWKKRWVFIQTKNVINNFTVKKVQNSIWSSKICNKLSEPWKIFDKYAIATNERRRGNCIKELFANILWNRDRSLPTQYKFVRMRHMTSLKFLNIQQVLYFGKKRECAIKRSLAHFYKYFGAPGFFGLFCLHAVLIWKWRSLLFILYVLREKKEHRLRIKDYSGD